MLRMYNTDRNRTPPSDCFWKLSLKIFPSGDKPILCKKNSKTVTLKSDVSTCSPDWYQLAGTLMCKMFYLVNFALFW